MAYGVIGNTAVFGTAILGSSPGRPAVPVSFGWRVLFLLVLLYDAHLTAGGHSVFVGYWEVPTMATRVIWCRILISITFFTARPTWAHTRRAISSDRRGRPAPGIRPGESPGHYSGL